MKKSCKIFVRRKNANLLRRRSPDSYRVAIAEPATDEIYFPLCQVISEVREVQTYEFT